MEIINFLGSLVVGYIKIGLFVYAIIYLWSMTRPIYKSEFIPAMRNEITKKNLVNFRFAYVMSFTIISVALWPMYVLIMILVGFDIDEYLKAFIETATKP